MEGEVIDFDPLTEEGRENINDAIDDEYESLLQQEDETFFKWWDRFTERFGRGAKYAASRIRDLYRARNPKSSVPEYLKLDNLENIRYGIPENLSQSWIDAIELQHNESTESVAVSVDQFKDIFPRANLDKVDFIYTTDGYGREIILVRLKNVPKGTPAPYVAIDGDGTFNSRGKIPKSILEALGSPNLRIQEENLSQRLSDSLDSFQDALSDTSTVVENEVADLSEAIDNMQGEGKDTTKEEMELQDLKEADPMIEGAKRLANKIHRDMVVRTGLEQEVEELKAELAANEQAHIRHNEALVGAHGRELEAGRKALAEVTEKKTQLQNHLKERGQQLKDLDLKYRQAAAEALNKEHALKRLTGVHNDFVENYLQEFDALSKERDQIFKEKAVTEEKLRQREQAVEDYERKISSLEQTLRDETKTEEEKEAIREELERLTKARDEAKEEVVQKERELGLTRREKILRYLRKAGLALGVAGAIASIVSLIMNALNNTGAAVKKLGTAVSNLGKKWQPPYPG